MPVPPKLCRCAAWSGVAFPYVVDIVFHNEALVKTQKNLQALRELADPSVDYLWLALAQFSSALHHTPSLGFDIFTLAEIEMLNLSPDHFLSGSTGVYERMTAHEMVEYFLKNVEGERPR